jgi:hypothetical protein
LNDNNKPKNERDAASLEINRAARDPEQGTRAGPKALAAAAVAAIMAVSQQAKRRRRSGSGSQRLRGNAGKLCAIQVGK